MVARFVGFTHCYNSSDQMPWKRILLRLVFDFINSCCFLLLQAYACATFLLHWVDLLKGMEFQDIIMFLQKVPTGHWTEKEVELILSQAFMYQNKFGKSKLVT